MRNDQVEQLRLKTDEMNSKYESYIRELTSTKDQKIEQKDGEISKLNASLTSKQNENSNLNDIIKSEKEIYTTTINTLKHNLTEMEKEISRSIQHSKQIESEFEEKSQKLKVQKQEIEQLFEQSKSQLDKKYKEDVENIVVGHKNEVQDFRKEFDRILKDLRSENECVNERLADLQEI